MSGAWRHPLRLLGAVILVSAAFVVIMVVRADQSSGHCEAAGGYLCPAQVPQGSQVPVSTGPGLSTPAVTVLHPDVQTNVAFEQAFEAYTSIGACQAVVAPHTEHEARINATGELIAVAGFEPAASCKTLYGEPARDAGPFSPTTPVEYILRYDDGTPGTWGVVIDAGIPFPCPLHPGDVAYVPTDVIEAWQLEYHSASCRPTYQGR